MGEVTLPAAQVHDALAPVASRVDFIDFVAQPLHLVNFFGFEPLRECWWKPNQLLFDRSAGRREHLRDRKKGFQTCCPCFCFGPRIVSGSDGPNPVPVDGTQGVAPASPTASDGMSGTDGVSGADGA